MCSLLVDSCWRRLGLGARETFDCCFFLTKALLVYDVVTDFMYWNRIRDDGTIPAPVRWAVLACACGGVLLDAVASLCICTWSPPDSWGKDEEEASNRYQLGQRRLALAMILVEDLPQIGLSSWITVRKREVTRLWLVTVAASLLNLLRVVVLNCTYVACAARAKRLMVQEQRSQVRVRVCGWYTLFDFKWAPVGYFGDMGCPKGGRRDVELMRVCCDQE